MSHFTLSNITMCLYYIALFSTILFIIKTVVFMFTGGDSEVVADFNSECEFETSFNFISIQSVLAFFMGFGWSGLAALTQWNMRIRFTLIIAIVFGLFLMFMSAYLMFLVKKLNKHIVVDYSKSIGTTGKAYTKIEPHRKGKIEIEINGRLSIEDAVNNSDIEIPSFSEIKIVDYKDKTIYIEKI